MAAVCSRLGLSGAETHRFPDGSLPVHAVGDHLVLKLYPDEETVEARNEATVLRGIEGRLSVATPTVEAAGEADGWHYLLMRRLRGESLKAVWPRLSSEERAELATRLGAVLAELHAIDDIPLDQRGSWTGFLAHRRSIAAAYHRGLGLGEEWLRQIPDFLDAVPLGTPPPVLLHTEFMPEHVLVRQDSAGWRPTGLFDFEPAMNGAPEYDFVAAAVFVASGDSGVWHRMLLGYGQTPGDLDHDFARRCLAYTLLHRYSNLYAYLRRLPAPPHPTLDALARAWFG